MQYLVARPPYYAYMTDDSPPPFIVIRSPQGSLTPLATVRGDAAYTRGLELVRLVHDLLDRATARYYLKDRLDRAATDLVFALDRGGRAHASLRWPHYRVAERLAADVATVLDILLAQGAAPAVELDAAKARIRELLALIAPYARG